MPFRKTTILRTTAGCPMAVREGGGAALREYRPDFMMGGNPSGMAFSRKPADAVTVSDYFKKGEIK